MSKDAMVQYILADLDIKQGQPQLCIRIVLNPPSMLPLCDSASHFSLQKPIAQMRLPPSGWNVHWMC